MHQNHQNQGSRPRRRLALGVAVVAGVLSILVACGGGSVGSNGTGSPVVPLGLSVGTVSGLGSVIVDGTRHDDSAARVEISREGTDTEVGEVRIGHRVSLEFAPDSVGAQALQRIELMPSVVGRVSERTGDTLGMLGQTVSVNGDPALGPVTAFDPPLSSLADVQLGDMLEVHALAQHAGGGVTDVRLVATRIERRTALAGVRVSGTVAELGTEAGGAYRFRLGALTVRVPATAVLLPAGLALQDTQPVTVYAAESAFDPVTLTLVAARLQRSAVEGTTASTLRRAGLVGNWTGRALVLDGVNVLVDAGTVVLPAGQSITNGAYVQVSASLDAAGQWHASRVERLIAATTKASAELRGTLDDWVVSVGTFSLRDTKVSVTSATRLDLGGCRATALVDGLYVEVKGTPTAQGVAATSITCEQEPTGTTSRLKRRGVVLAADAATRQFTLRHQAGDPALTVRWTDLTYWHEPLDEVALVALAGAGREIEVQGSLSADGLQMVARKVKLREAGR